MRLRALTTGKRSASPRRRRTRVTSVVATLAVATATVLQAVVATTPANAVQAAPGAGFTVTAGDLSFILKQIKIAERHSATLTASNPCGTLVGPEREPDPRPADAPTGCARSTDPATTSSRTEASSPRPTSPSRATPSPSSATPSPSPPSLPVGAPGPTSYAQKKGNVVDSQPRMISNLIVDQTSTNPAAIAAAQFPVRTQGNTGVVPCTTDPDPTADPPVWASRRTACPRTRPCSSRT